MILQQETGTQHYGVDTWALNSQNNRITENFTENEPSPIPEISYICYYIISRQNKGEKKIPLLPELPLQSYYYLVFEITDCETICSGIWEIFFMLKSPNKCKGRAEVLADMGHVLLCWHLGIQRLNDDDSESDLNWSLKGKHHLKTEKIQSKSDWVSQMGQRTLLGCIHSTVRLMKTAVKVAQKQQNFQS